MAPYERVVAFRCLADVGILSSYAMRYMLELFIGAKNKCDSTLIFTCFKVVLPGAWRRKIKLRVRRVREIVFRSNCMRWIRLYGMPGRVLTPPPTDPQCMGTRETERECSWPLVPFIYTCEKKRVSFV